VFGVEKGDCVVIYMLMVFEVVIVMLVCVRIGVVYLVVFGGFVLVELVVCIDDVCLKVVVLVFCGIELLCVVEYKLMLDVVIEWV